MRRLAGKATDGTGCRARTAATTGAGSGLPRRAVGLGTANPDACHTCCGPPGEDRKIMSNAFPTGTTRCGSCICLSPAHARRRPNRLSPRPSSRAARTALNPAVYLRWAQDHGRRNGNALPRDLHHSRRQVHCRQRRTPRRGGCRVLPCRQTLDPRIRLRHDDQPGSAQNGRDGGHLDFRRSGRKIGQAPDLQQQRAQAPRDCLYAQWPPSTSTPRGPSPTGPPTRS